MVAREELRPMGHGSDSWPRHPQACEVPSDPQFLSVKWGWHCTRLRDGVWTVPVGRCSSALWFTFGASGSGFEPESGDLLCA